MTKNLTIIIRAGLSGIFFSIILCACSSDQPASKNTKNDRIIDSIAQAKYAKTLQELRLKYHANNLFDTMYAYTYQFQNSLDSNNIAIINLGSAKQRLTDILKADSGYTVLFNDYDKYNFYDLHGDYLHRINNFELFCTPEKLSQILIEKNRSILLIIQVKSSKKIKYALMPTLTGEDTADPNAEIEIAGTDSYIVVGKIIEIVNLDNL